LIFLKPQIKIMRLSFSGTQKTFVQTIFVFLFLTNLSCKKSDSKPDPIAITVVADKVYLNLGPSDNFNGLGASFTYKGTVYNVSVGGTGFSTGNGSAVIADTNMIATTSTLSGSNSSIIVENPTVPNTIVLSMDSFIFVYGVGLIGSTGNALPSDVNDFNKITLQVDATTRFYVSGYADTFSDKYVNDLPALSGLVNNAAKFVNAAGEKGFNITVDK